METQGNFRRKIGILWQKYGRLLTTIMRREEAELETELSSLHGVANILWKEEECLSFTKVQMANMPLLKCRAFLQDTFFPS